MCVGVGVGGGFLVYKCVTLLLRQIIKTIIVMFQTWQVQHSAVAS